jgi:hypothetical protein
LAESGETALNPKAVPLAELLAAGTRAHAEPFQRIANGRYPPCVVLTALPTAHTSLAARTLTSYKIWLEEFAGTGAGTLAHAVPFQCKIIDWFSE